MHSLVVKKNGEYFNEAELREHIWLHNSMWSIRDDEDITFGRAPFDCLSRFEEKVRYAIASLCGWHEDKEERFREIELLVKELIPECTGIILPNVHWYGDEEDKTYYGGVDEDILSPFLRAEGITLKEFLTNKKYVVIVDGDEYCIWPSMKEAGLVNTEEIEKEY